MIRFTPRAQIQLGVAATLGWLSAVLSMPNGWLKIGISAAFLLLLPGFLLFRLVRRDEELPRPWTSLGYSVGLSLLFLMVVGLIVNTVLPPLGDSTPLSTVPLAAGVAAGVFGLLRAASRANISLIPKLRRPKISVADLWFSYSGLLAVALSVLGAISLNNGGTNGFTLWMLTIVSAMCLGLPWLARHMGRTAIGLGIYLMSLALLFATSLRGWFITGHDVMQEYQVFQLTSQHSLWSMNFFHDPYNACLSITILPTMLQRLTGISDPYVYKVLIQLVFAVVPVLVYLLAARFVKKLPAALVAVVYITFPTFMMDFPMLNRQEVAFLFFALAMLALFERGLRRSVRITLLILLFGGMVLSHYSTSYIAVGALVLYKLIETLIRLFRLAVKQKPAPLLPLSWFLVLILGGMVYIWNVPMTNTAGQFESTLSTLSSSLPSLLQGMSSAKNQLSGPALFNAYVQNAPLTRDLSASSYYPSSLSSRYPTVETSAQSAPLTKLGRALSSVGVPVGHLLDMAKTLYGLMIEGLIVAGLAVMAFVRTWRIRLGYLLLGITFFALIVLQVLLPNAINYGLLRLMQQGLIFLGLPMIAAVHFGSSLVKIPEKLRLGLVSAIFTVGFALTCGLAAALTGGYPQALVAANSGFYYDAYYTHADEIAGYNWLNGNMPLGSVVDADEFTRRKMAAYIGVYPRVALVPSVIAKDGYFFLSYGNTTSGSMPNYYNGTLIYQQIPTQFLTENKNLLYSNGGVEIYR